MFNRRHACVLHMRVLVRDTSIKSCVSIRAGTTEYPRSTSPLMTLTASLMASPSLGSSPSTSITSVKPSYTRSMIPPSGSWLLTMNGISDIVQLYAGCCPGDDVAFVLPFLYRRRLHGGHGGPNNQQFASPGFCVLLQFLWPAMLQVIGLSSSSP